MLKIIFAFILIIHGLIHQMGFLKELKLAKVEQLTGITLIPLSGNLAKTAGILWFIAGILFIALTVPYLLKKDWWWIGGLLAIAISQVLIIIYWKDAKFGTIANLIILAGCLLSFGNWTFTRMVNRELNTFLADSITEKKTVSNEMLSGLPLIVQKWLKRSNIKGKDITQTVYLEQKGEMRTSPGGNWMPFAANQRFTTAEPGFIWTVRVKAAPFLFLTGRDKYENGHGHMLIKLLSLFTVADSKGETIDQGTMIRYLAEIIWFPSAALNKYISWEEISAVKARAEIAFGGINASGVFTFNNEGDLQSFEAKRYYDRKDGPTLEDWLVTIDGKGFRDFSGIRIPAKSSVTWKLKEGDFTWAKMEITELRFNPGNIRDIKSLFPEKLPAESVLMN